MTDDERIRGLGRAPVTLANDIGHASRSQSRISVSLTAELSSIQNKALAAFEQFKPEVKIEQKPTDNKKH